MKTKNTRGKFAQEILKGLGYRVWFTPAKTFTRVTALLAWMVAESGWNEPNNGVPGQGARFNPLNTTQGSGSDYNSAGVKNFSSFDEGVKETVATLKNGFYPGVLAAIRTADSYKICVAVTESPWGTGAFASLLPEVRAHRWAEFAKRVG